MKCLLNKLMSLRHVVINFRCACCFFYCFSCFTDQFLLTYPGEDIILEKPVIDKSKNLVSSKGHSFTNGQTGKRLVNECYIIL
jgi:hypothetical protein